MAGPSDKARFYLESTVDELNELERKKIFSREEIASIAKRRSDFEHVINARGSHASDYVRYIEYETNLDALRRKRIKRLGVRSTGSGQRTIFFIFNRATRKFAGDLNLWFMYINFARKEKAYKKLNEIFTSLVRLHPTNPDVWIYAAKYFMDTQADITNARSYMQRGLRFCKNSEDLWLEYAKLETLYIGKIAGRRKVLGLDDKEHAQTTVEDDENADMIALPSVTAEDINPSLRKEDGRDEVALQNLASAPVLTGAIPIAVFDSAMKQFKGDAELADRFFGMFADFDQLPCLERILQHVLELLQKKAPESVHTAICKSRMRLLRLHPTSPDFPSALGDSLQIIDSALRQFSEKLQIAETALRQLLPFLRACDTSMIDPAIETVLLASLRKYTKLLGAASGKSTGDAIADLVESLQREGKAADAQRLVRSSMKKFGSNERLQEYCEALDT